MMKTMVAAKISRICLAISAVTTLCFLSACEKEDLNPNYPFTIIVETQADSIRLANVTVSVQAPIPDGAGLTAKQTNENGTVSFKYNKAAIFEVVAYRGSVPDNIEWIGCGDVRLVANREVTKTIYLRPVEDSSLLGCSL